MKQRLVWFTLGFTSAVAAVMTIFVFKDLWFDHDQLKEKVDTIDIKISNLEPAVLRPNTTTLISLNVSVGTPLAAIISPAEDEGEFELKPEFFDSHL